MDFASVLQAIATLGFPIVCCLMLFWYVYKRENKYDEQINELTNKHEAEVHQLVEAVNNNTRVMQRILDKLGVDDNDG